MRVREGKVFVPEGAHPWPHELNAANALAAAGHSVTFLLEAKGKLVKSASQDVPELRDLVERFEVSTFMQHGGVNLSR